MHFLVAFAFKIALNAAIFYEAGKTFSVFSLVGGQGPLFIAALVITTLNFFVKPILRFITTPLVWITVGLFLIIINIVILWIGDYLLPSLTIGSFETLFWTSTAIAIINGIF